MLGGDYRVFLAGLRQGVVMEIRGLLGSLNVAAI
jgi:hypothetical protein